MGVEITSKASMVEETNFDRKYREMIIEKLRNSGLKGKALLGAIKDENCKMVIPTGKNMYKWAESKPEGVVFAGMERVEKIFDLSHEIYSGFSAGKDSTISANLLLLELNLRYMRYALGINRHGEESIDILDSKWAKDQKKVWMQMQDAEIVFTLSNEYTMRFMKKYGPEGLNLLEFNWFCLQMSWQSGVSFDSGVLVSWDRNKEGSWVQDMPTRADLHGFDVVSEYNFTKCNSVSLETLSPESQEYHKEHKNVVIVPRRDIFGIDLDQQNTKEYWDEEVEAVCNFGRGPLTFYQPYDHEKDFNSAFSLWYADTSWLVDKNSLEDLENIQKAIAKEYPDLADEVWQVTPSVSSL